MKPSVSIDAKHLKILQEILRKHLRAGTIVWVFGSRSKGTARKYSDLDLLVDADEQPLALSTMVDLRNDFEESDLPYKVDVIDWNSASQSFQESVKDDRSEIIRI